MKKYRLFTPDCPLRNKEDFLTLYRSLMRASNTPATKSGFDMWFETCIDNGTILAADEIMKPETP